MKDENILRYTLRVNRCLFNKFKFVADYNGRSTNKEIEQLMREKVDAFEKENGKIDFSSKK